MTSPAAICPVCSRPVPTEGDETKHLPFCSRRCREVDFFRWCDGKYAIVEPVDPFDLDEERSWSPSDDAE
ncbi:MAG: DNA gyrase inhibitor YacG [Planctomycetaceae bacterium]|nr:DNA gyrase inhibitor YacG [Planctomycetaceae bacterium]